MHTHACPLFSISKLLGVEFTETGLALAPKLPLPSFRFDSPLLGVVKSSRGYEGWYNPLQHNTWSILLKIAVDEAKHLSRVEVNGNRIHAPIVDGAVEMRGEGGGGDPLRWTVVRG